MDSAKNIKPLLSDLWRVLRKFLEVGTEQVMRGLHLYFSEILGNWSVVVPKRKARTLFTIYSYSRIQVKKMMSDQSGVMGKTERGGRIWDVFCKY